ncbi:MAG: DNA-directed RNA polymerase subunit F [Metallosphaera yellowstonensis]|jgi:DNA-directed RNA polymerase subunit F|uniref:DNA-directed RNA polymerase subunit Rpo4 n=1 Tax=Metallosphaera yellowstonensis MK1 TaxID=671065 RepID=H2C6N1_9CREN|nr:DNA-directed RNA polymerase subunit F [Metallosphaera yellowstonensis]EHP69458.1 uncharacterized protein conserved in archaea [Metallosphaera yellowstonensis MK1]
MPSIQVIEEEFVPYSVAKKILGEVISSGISSSVLQKTFEYLNSLEKCSAENAIKLMEEISSIIQKPEVKAMISSLCPETPDEVRAISILEGRNLTQEEVQKIIEAVKRYKNN